MTKTMMEIPVLIAGGGPVGITLAMDLATHGIQSIVLESRGTLPPNPRCNTTNARSMEIFRRLGCADAVRAAGLPADNNTDVVYMTSMNGEEILRYVRPTPEQWFNGTPKGIGSDWPTPEPQHFISQLYMEPVLREHAVQHHGVDLRLGWELVTFEQDAEGVNALIREVATGDEQTIHAAYLVGADGGASRVRRQIGARLEGLSKVGDACSIFIRSSRLTEIYREHPGWMYRFLGGVIAVAIDGVDEWLIHTHPPPGIALEDFDFEPQMFAAIGEKFEYEVLNITRWTARAMVCNKYREGRVILAGDAAHIWIPMGGFGMNSGIGDAISIGWRLAGVLQGWLDPKILDTYETERVPLGGRVAAQAARWGAELRPLLRQAPDQHQHLLDSKAARQELGQRLREINTSEWESVGMMLGYYYTDSPVIAYDGTEPPVFDLSNYRETSWPGVRAPHLWRESVDAKRVALFDQFGTAFTLLRIGTGGPDAPSGKALIVAAQARGIPLTVLDVPETEAVRKYEGYGLVLVRPDQHIVWRSKVEPQDATAILDRVTGRLIPDYKVVEHSAQRLTSDAIFPEGLRCKRGQLTYSDMTGQRVLSYDPKTGRQQTLFKVEQQPNGLGHLPDGRLIIASMFDAKLLIVEDGKLTTYVDLSHLVTGYLGDVVVDRSGRIYVGDVGARVLHGELPKPGRVILVDSDRSARVVLENIQFPNGMAITPDGNTLLLAETMTSRILQCRIEVDGNLREPRSYIELDVGENNKGGGAGMAIEHNGAIWVCLPRMNAVEHYDNRGHLTARISTDGTPISCALSEDDQTLYIVGAENLPDDISGVFTAIANKSTRGWLAQAHIGTTATQINNLQRKAA